MRPTKKEINNYMDMIKNAIPGALSIAKKLLSQGENEMTIYRYLTIQSKIEHAEAIDIIRQLNID